MKKLKSILIAMVLIFIPNIVLASSGSSESIFPIGFVIRNRNVCFDTYVYFCTFAFIWNNFKGKF